MSEHPEDTVVARVVVERQLATPEEVREAIDHRSRVAHNGAPRGLGDVLVDLGFLTRTQLTRVSGANDDSGNRPAQQIPGYQLQKKVGAGAMAVVYRAKQVSLDRTVAVKVLPKRLSKNVEFVERFYREGRAAAQLNHNNIVTAIDVGESGGFHYFVMEFVEGCTVYDELAAGKVYTEKEALQIVTQIAWALDHAHERGFIHRDVKPKNIMLTKDRVAKLADMGLARETTDLQAAMAEAGRAYGTPYYISPEQIRGEVDIDPRADLYSLGATFYHMITGKVPFEAATPSAVMHKHLNQALVPPDHINTQLSAGAGAVIEMLMAKKREQRYAGARQLLEDLELLSRGLPPKYAQHHVDHDLIDGLAAGKDVEQGSSPQSRMEATRTSEKQNMLLFGLSALTVVSILINIILIATRK